MNRDHAVIFETASKHWFSDSFVDYEGYSFSSKGFLSTVVDIMVIWIKFPHLVHFSSLLPKMLMFTLAVSYLTTSNLPWFMDLTFQVPMQYLSFTASDFTSITSHIHNWSLFSLWLCLFILSGVISPLISSSILGTYWPKEFLFQYPIILPFHTVHGVLQARIPKLFAIPSPVDHVLSELSTMTCQSWVALHGMVHSFNELERLWSMW